MGISGLGTLILGFAAPKTPLLKFPGDKKVEKKGHKNHPLKKGTGTAFCTGPLTPKKKSGLSRRKLVGLDGQIPSWALTTHLSTEHYPISGPIHPLSPIGFSLGLFLTRVSQVRMYVGAL